MNSQKAIFLQIGNAIIFVAAIVLFSYLLADTQYEQYSNTAMYLLIALWFIPNSLLSSLSAGKQESIKFDILCIKRKIAALFNRG